MSVARSSMGLAVLAALFTACVESGEPEFATELGVDLDAMEQRSGGLYVEDVEVGTGAEAADGDLVAIHYTGWLADGTEFDSSRGGGIPLETVIGEGNVIQGWDEGVPGMREGGRRRLVIPPAMAYGAAGAGGVIPPDATLVFDVELVEIRTADAAPVDSTAVQDSVQVDSIR